MIKEIVTCDMCEYIEHMRGGMVPASWVTHDGRHYCCLTCAGAYRPVAA